MQVMNVRYIGYFKFLVAIWNSKIHIFTKILSYSFIKGWSLYLALRLSHLWPRINISEETVGLITPSLSLVCTCSSAADSSYPAWNLWFSLWNTGLYNHHSVRNSAKLNYFSALDSLKISPISIFFFKLREKDRLLSPINCIYETLTGFHYTRVLILEWMSGASEGLLKHRSLAQLQSFRSGGLGWGSSICIAKHSQRMATLLV